MPRPNPTRQKEARKLLKQRLAKLDFQNETMRVIREAKETHHLHFQVPNGERFRVRMTMSAPMPQHVAIGLESCLDGSSWPTSAPRTTTRPSLWRRGWQLALGWVRP